MSVLPIALGLVAGVCGYAGLLHMLIGRQRAEMNAHLMFALLCFCIVGAALANAALYQAQTVAAYTSALKWQQSFAFAAVVPLLWFVAFSTGARPLVFLVGMSGVAVFALAVNLAAPFGIFFTQIGGITSIITAWGERIPQPAATTASQWLLYLQVAFLALFPYLGYACYYQYRRGERSAALRLGLGLGILLAARWYDRADLFQGTPDLSLMVYGYLALIVVMSLGLLDDVVGVALIKRQAEAALHALNAELEQRVVARTAELQATNMQLEQQRQLAERRRGVAESLGDLLDLLNANRPLEDLWTAITAGANRLFEAQTTAVYQHADGVCALLAASGRDTDALAADQTSIQQLLGRALAAGYPLAIAELVAPPLAPATQSRAATATQRGPASRAALAVPVAGVSFSGVLLLVYDGPRVFAEEDVALAAALGDQVALAIDNAHLRRQVAATAVTGERTRLGHELHDSVTQTLYTIAAIAEALPHVWERRPQEARDALDQLRHLARGALAEMRNLLLELRPTALLERPLGELLHQLTDALLGRTQMAITTTVVGERTLPPEVQVALYRIAQEALNNSVKHACASRAWVELCCTPAQVSLRICDDGRGFDPLAEPARGFGLRNMRERAGAIGAAFRLESRPDRGTEVRVTWSGT